MKSNYLLVVSCSSPSTSLSILVADREVIKSYPAIMLLYEYRNRSVFTFTCQRLCIWLQSLRCCVFLTRLESPYEPPPGGSGVHWEPVLNCGLHLLCRSRVLFLDLLLRMCRDTQPTAQPSWPPQVHTLQLYGNVVNGKWGTCSKKQQQHETHPSHKSCCCQYFNLNISHDLKNTLYNSILWGHMTLITQWQTESYVQQHAAPSTSQWSPSHLESHCSWWLQNISKSLSQCAVHCITYLALSTTTLTLHLGRTRVLLNIPCLQ